ncbi:MAG: type II toxin-antitoxin system prevent-host-death family antitoxin [Coriobacteriales bacterium]|nr:type II toxin-antitoxin system prevent-host-death family antitoxin [Coriobacteriales bacterium]
MPAIMPVSTLRSYTEVLDDVRPGSPVFLTKNGHGRYAILDMADYDRLVAEQTLFSELERGRMSGEAEGWLSTKDVRAYFAGRSEDGR